MVGRMLGKRYKIMEKIGEGGMAVVYKALDTLLNRVVTVKVLREQYTADEDFIRRFRREAQAAASLSNSHIVNIYDVGEEDNVYFIVMEYVDGCTLKELINKEKRLPVDQAMHIARQICEALVHAHSQRVIHRDIKPQNILITDGGTVKVTDFGIAQAASSTTMTYGDSVLGSVHYFSPEQARGGVVGEQSDIYSLGIVLYEMITGKIPFEGESPISVALKHLQEEIKPLRELVPDIPEPVEKLVMKAVQKKQTLRYQTARDLLQDINSWINHKKVETASLNPDDAPTRLLQPVREAEKSAYPKRKFWLFKRKAVIGLIAVILLLILTGGAIAFRSFMAVPEVEVPKVEGLTLEEAIDGLEKAGLYHKVVSEVHNEEVPADHIISQRPEAGSKVRQGREIELVVSLGPPTVEVPLLEGRTEIEARLLLEEMGLNMKVDQEYSQDVAEGTIIRQDPRQGFTVSKGDMVRVVVSQGPSPFALNDFLGWSLEEARQWINRHDLQVRHLEERYSQEYPAGHIIDQNPKPGTQVRAGDVVDLVVSKGPDPAAPVNLEIHIRDIPEGEIIRIDIEDYDGSRTVFEGPYQGGTIKATGKGSGRVILMWLQEGDYIVVDTWQFPR